jgi:hypothetical protein
MTLWEGVEPYSLDLSLMFDGWTSQRSQETVLRKLTAVARGDSESPPGTLFVTGLPLPADEWVIEGIDFGDPILALDGNRLRQALTLSLREYVPPEYIRRYPPRKTKSQKSVTIRAKKGDTPAKIAKRRKCDWKDLRTLNSFIRSANQTIKEGTQVRVPKPKSARKRGKAPVHRSKSH